MTIINSGILNVHFYSLYYLFLMYIQYVAACYIWLALLEEECKLAGSVEIFHRYSDYNRMMAFLFPIQHDYEIDEVEEEEEVEQSLAFFHFQFRLHHGLFWYRNQFEVEWFLHLMLD